MADPTELKPLIDDFCDDLTEYIKKRYAGLTFTEVVSMLEALKMALVLDCAKASARKMLEDPTRND